MKMPQISNDSKDYMVPSRRTRAVFGCLFWVLLIFSVVKFSDAETYISGAITILLCLLSGVLTMFLNDCFRHRKGLLAFAWLLPGLLIFIFALLARFPAFILVAVIVISLGIAETVYSKYVSDILTNDIGASSPLILFLLIYPFNIGIIDQTILLQIYGVIFQSFVTLVGLVFTLGVFIFGTRKNSRYERIKDALGGFLLLFILVSLLSLLGLLNSKGELDLSRRFLFSRGSISIPNIFRAALMVGTLCLGVSSLTSLVVMFGIS